MNVRIGERPHYHVTYMRYVGPYGPHGIPALWVYRGNPDVAGRPGGFRCELCIPVRPR